MIAAAAGRGLTAAPAPTEPPFDLGRVPVPVLVGLVVAVAGWLLLVAVAAAATRPRSVRPGPGSLDLGPEPPAVVNLLAGGWRMTTDAMSATLLDLAARDALDLDQHGPEPERTVIRLRGGPPGDLSPYESRVYRRVERLATGGVVPAAALPRGSRRHAAGWWRAFRREVIREAQRHGLSQNRWNHAALVALGGASMVPGTAAGLAFGFASRSAGSGVAIGVLVWILLGLLIRRRNRQRDTAAGRAAAARWLGVRDYLARNEAFERMPPAAVAIWDRHLAYAAAMGVADTATRVLPFGAQDERLAWSAYGGNWHRVRIRYPGRRLVEGRSPGWMTFAGLAAIAAGYWAIGGLQWLRDRLDRDEQFGADVLDGRVDDQLIRDAQPWLIVVAVLLIGWGVYTMIRGIVDLAVRRPVDGEVLRVRERTSTDEDGNTHILGYEVAIDDGRSPKTRAWWMAPDVASGVRQGNVVQITVGHRLRHVYRLQVLHAGWSAESEHVDTDSWDGDVVEDEARVAARARDRAAAASLDSTPPLTAAEVSAAFGRRFGEPRSLTGDGPAPVLGHRMWEFRAEADRGRVLLEVATGWLARKMTTPNRRSTPLPGLGDAALVRDDAVIVRCGAIAVGIMVRHIPPAAARMALPHLAHAAIGRLPAQPAGAEGQPT